MTTEEKALALVNEVAIEECEEVNLAPHKSLCAALRLSVIEHEATKQELHDLRQKVNDIASVYNKMAFTVTETEPHLSNYRVIIGFDKIADASMCHDRLVSLLDFLNPKPKPDPLINVAKMLGYYNTAAKHLAGDIRAALDAAGFEIREKNDG